MVGGVGAVTLLLVLGIVISLLVAGHKSSAGCIDFAFPYSTGGQEVYRCGASARATCATARTPGGYTADTERAIERACRTAGLPVG